VEDRLKKTPISPVLVLTTGANARWKIGTEIPQAAENWERSCHALAACGRAGQSGKQQRHSSGNMYNNMDFIYFIIKNNLLERYARSSHVLLHAQPTEVLKSLK